MNHRPCSVCGLSEVEFWPKQTKCKSCQSNYDRQRLYGVTPEKFQQLLDEQGGVCAYCHKPETKMRNGKVIPLCVDHDHETGQVRGLLCNACNLSIRDLEYHASRVKYIEFSNRKHQMSSTFSVEVVRLGPIGKHPNADNLGITHIWAYQVIVRLEDWKEGDLAAYIPPDSVVPDTEDYAFLEGHRRITVRRFRGLYSMGLLMPAPEGFEPGDDVSEAMGITHYEPPLKSFRGAYTAGDSEKAPEGFKPRYDVEHFLRYGTMFQPGETVIATEKIHGANGRWCYQDGHFHAGSHNEWKKYDPEKPSIWWKVLMRNEGVKQFLQEHEGFTLYGEVYGCVQDLRYGHKDGEISVRFFDVWNERELRWMDHYEARTMAYPLLSEDDWVPLIYEGPCDAEVLEKHSMGPSTLPGAEHHREGIVIKPPKERLVYGLGDGRLQLKLVNPAYLEKSAKKAA